MKTPDAQAAAQAWINDLVDPMKWQTWMQQAQSANLLKSAAPADFPLPIDQQRMAQLHEQYVQELTALWQNLASARSPAVEDKRFSGAAWHSNPFSAFNAGVYLLNARFLSSMVDAVEAAPKVKQKIRFALQQTVDALSPANFLATNPEAQQKILDTRGESIMRGIEHMLADMQKGHISHTDETAFEVGRNVATTEGAVVFENELFQLIQYKPQTRTVYEKPLLIVPPCINKFYIMDLQPANSLVRYAVMQGHTVLLVSWCNAQQAQAGLGWDDYIEHGAIRALHAAQEISGQQQINALGFCVGGTIISTALAVLKARGEKPVASLTLLTALLDFSDTGALDVYIDEAQVAMRELEIGGGGLMPGREFSAAFSSLRPNDLVWNYVESNYLKGEDPPPFDLLYWNADSTNLPGPMFCWYLRNLYLEDSLKTPGKLRVCGQPVDLGTIDVPALIYASREDHIVPWTSAYGSTRLLNRKKPSNNHFLLGASGHIAGVINPPEKKKRSYWVNKALPADAQAWLQGATEKPGSWWPEWSDFLARHAGKEVPAPRRYGNASYKPIEPAPGRYVKVKA
ncbi:MAG: class I poly(R)-hydroxyalkanoic acid synthase [Lacisediminimonas sp.]|nr:class I poly(R)-hydroxyalkanoic acid synthase [Lacisediminimonas sp.]